MIIADGRRWAMVLCLALPAAVWGQDAERPHWAFQPPTRPAIPTVRHTDRVRTPIDAFLLARLEAKGLTFSPDADRVTLLRRATLDLIGLPPTPEEIDAFLADQRPNAFEQVVDRLLASPHFGERIGRHWLDVAGYADTVGFDMDANNIIQSEGKYRYRDYVIAAFNADKPYDRFITEQLAGDELVDWRKAPKFTPEIRESLIATGFLRTARDQTHEPESNIALCYYGVLHDTVAITGNCLLGLTLVCAQCHNHKFDPITQKEYYQLMALFTPAYNPRDWKPVYPWKPDIKDRGLPDVSVAERADIERHNADIERQVAVLRGRQTDLRRPYEARLREAKVKALPESIRADTVAALETPAAKRNEVQKYLAGKFEATLRVKPEEVAAALSAADQSTAARLDEEMAALTSRRRSFGKIQALYDVDAPPPTYLLRRGNFDTPGEEVQPGFPHILASSGKVGGPPVGATSGRRLAFAHWLTEPDSRAAALLARVEVNRLWQHTFGQGLVPTPENFGRSGEPPTHPELLEWLSSEFMHGGWRIKPILKMMMLSTAYRQTSRPEQTSTLNAQKIDPDNRLLWRMHLRRLEAEVIRDSLLAVSGHLDTTMGGPPILTRAFPDGRVIVDDKALPNSTAKGRRSVYLLFRRSYNLSLLTVFDQPAIALNCPGRDASAVPLQSLTMLNDAFVADQTRSFSERVIATAGASGEAAIRAAFRRALARQPSAAEVAICTRLLERQADLFRSAKHSPAEAERLALVQLCHTLLNTSEFLSVE